jgi:hypothetical protein
MAAGQQVIGAHTLATRIWQRCLARHLAGLSNRNVPLPGTRLRLEVRPLSCGQYVLLYEGTALVYEAFQKWYTTARGG